MLAATIIPATGCVRTCVPKIVLDSCHLGFLMFGTEEQIMANKVRKAARTRKKLSRKVVGRIRPLKTPSPPGGPLPIPYPN